MNPRAELERLRAVPRLEHRVAVALEDLAHEVPHDLLVLDEQDRLRPPRPILDDVHDLLDLVRARLEPRADRP